MALQNRISEYETINKSLIKSKTFSLIKRIGSPSKNAMVYLCSCEEMKFACKKYQTPCIKDIRLTLKLSSLVLRNINPHFMIVYKYSKGTLLNELAQGDLISFLKIYIRYDVLVNCMQQLLLCVLSFHVHCSMHHADCHQGNFLYKRIAKGGFIHYKINGKDIYLENFGYLWMINDYDLATEEVHKSYTDYNDSIQYFTKYKRNKKFNLVIDQVLQIIDANFSDKELFHELIDAHIFKNTCTGHIINNNPYIL